MQCWRRTIVSAAMSPTTADDGLPMDEMRHRIGYSHVVNRFDLLRSMPSRVSSRLAMFTFRRASRANFRSVLLGPDLCRSRNVVHVYSRAVAHAKMLPGRTTGSRSWITPYSPSIERWAGR